MVFGVPTMTYSVAGAKDGGADHRTVLLQCGDEMQLLGGDDADACGKSPLVTGRELARIALSVVLAAIALLWLSAVRQWHLDFVGSFLLAITGWSVLVNIGISYRVYLRFWDRQLAIGRADDFRDYARRVAVSGAAADDDGEVFGRVVEGEGMKQPLSGFSRERDKPTFV